MEKTGIKDITLAIGLITGFLFVVSIAVFYTYSMLQTGDFCSCTETIPVVIIMVASAGLFVGSFAYYFLIDRIVRNYRNNKSFEKALEPFLKLLNADEEKVVKLLLKNKELGQAKIGVLAELSRVRTTRVLQKLEDRGIIERQKKGKTNRVNLSGQIKKIME